MNGLLIDIVVECVEKLQSISPLDCNENSLEKMHRLILIICSHSYLSSNLFHYPPLGHRMSLLSQWQLNR